MAPTAVGSVFGHTSYNIPYASIVTVLILIIIMIASIRVVIKSKREQDIAKKVLETQSDSRNGNESK
jgi:hypothetical protein